MSATSFTSDYLESLSSLGQEEAQQQPSHHVAALGDETITTASSPETTTQQSQQEEQYQRILKSCDDIVKPMVWEDGKQISENAFCVDLPKELLIELRNYAERMGITDMYRNKLCNRNIINGQGPLHPGTENKLNLNGYNWMVQRPKSHWKSNMHWTSPGDEDAHNDYLRVLSAGGFDAVLEKVGTYFNLNAICAYHLSFIGVSYCEKGFIHADVNESGRKAFNMIIPLLLVDDKDEHNNQENENEEQQDQQENGPAGELEILSDDETVTQFYKYEYNVASMVGDNALHATASCDYRTKSSQSQTIIGEEETEIKNTMRMAATVYIGDITPTNVNHLLLSLTQAYPPVGDSKHLLERAGNHWSKTNPLKKLPSFSAPVPAYHVVQ